MTTRTTDRPAPPGWIKWYPMPVRAPRNGPAKRWRNMWVAIKPFTFASTGEPAEVGQVYWGRFRYPSKDIAETAAAHGLDAEMKAYGDHVAEYYGAFPVEAS